MSSKRTLLEGAFLLTIVSFLTRFMGFFYRIFLCRSFGEESVGLYQLIFPVFVLCLAFSTAGIQTALSRIVAYYKAAGKESCARDSLFISLVLSLFLSFLTMLFLQANAAKIALVFLGDGRCTNLLILMSYALPFASIHSCVCGYYFGLKEAQVPAFSQLLEQIIRIVTVLAVYYFASKKGIPLGISIAIIGLVVGEIASASCAILAFKLHKFTKVTPAQFLSYFRLLRELLVLSTPLTVNRILLSVLQSIEAVSIPMRLQLCNYTQSEALIIYGVLTGMALPCILFPSAITNSISLLLTPVVAEIQSASDNRKIRTLIRQVCYWCFSLGLLCCLFFLLTGSFIGMLLFHSEMAGRFIITLSWICPFLYLGSTLVSIVNGLGKTTVTFLVNTVGILLRILGVFLLIPSFGIEGYLWALLSSQLVTCLLTLGYLFFHLRSKRLY